MSIKFKVIERGQPGVSGGGQKKYYASPNITGELTLSQLSKRIERISTVSGADIRAVIYAIVDVMQDALADGQIVRIGELGSLRISLSSEGMNNAKEVTASSVKSSKVIFTPGKELKKLLSKLKYEKI